MKDYKKEDFNEPVFVLGDHEGFNKQTKKYLKKNIKRLSLGPQIYFTSQSITIINYELDNL
jgi:tRNA pseudouridine-54 N-methylase